MSKVAVLVATGFEEGETFTIVDIMRRLGIECDSFYFEDEVVTGMQNIKVKCDKKFSDEVLDYDVVFLPGGRPGGENLRTNPQVIELLKKMNEIDGKYIAAMCSGTTVLAEAEIIEGKKMTGYTGYAEKLPKAIFLEDVVVADQNLITSQGPATPYPIAYKIAEILGKDTSAIREKMLYTKAGGI